MSDGTHPLELMVLRSPLDSNTQRRMLASTPRTTCVDCRRKRVKSGGKREGKAPAAIGASPVQRRNESARKGERPGQTDLQEDGSAAAVESEGPVVLEHAVLDLRSGHVPLRLETCIEATQRITFTSRRIHIASARQTERRVRLEPQQAHGARKLKENIR